MEKFNKFSLLNFRLDTFFEDKKTHFIEENVRGEKCSNKNKLKSISGKYQYTLRRTVYTFHDKSMSI